MKTDIGRLAEPEERFADRPTQPPIFVRLDVLGTVADDDERRLEPVSL
jgi:hypothetical protein